ncbi:MAG: hypothetical protein K2G53_00290 [Muribaculaceae bacterium]|nr:hypothetical protein [Bacteroidales bacterium]MDE6070971.1 hypothetical protein [Muribaculaceae bacterium]
MAESLIEILQQLKAKQELLTLEVERLRARNQELENLNLALQQNETEALKKRDEALLEVEYLKVSYKLAESPDNLVATRRLIAGLIRNIDRCIAMLKE